MKWLVRILLGLLILVIAFTGIKFFQYKSGVEQVAKQLPGNSSVIETAVGTVEYLVQGNSNKFVLLIHGTPGSYHTFMADALVDRGFTVISPSRPGYFRTPLSSGATIEAQAKMYAALLDALSIESASIIGFSGGGPSALMYASLFPDRCNGLVVMASTGQPFEAPERSSMETLVMNSEFGRWTAYTSLSGEFDTQNDEDAALSYLQTAFFPMKQVLAGEENDFKQFTSNWYVDLSSIQCPTLIIHGTDDELIPFSEAIRLDQQIPGATLRQKDGQDHFTVVFFEFGENLKEAANFLSSFNY